MGKLFMVAVVLAMPIFPAFASEPAPSAVELLSARVVAAEAQNAYLVKLIQSIRAQEDALADYWAHWVGQTTKPSE